VDRPALALPLAALLVDEPETARPPRGGAGRRRGAREAQRRACLRRGVHPPDHRLAGVCPGGLLALHARLHRYECPGGVAAPAVVLLDGADRDAVSARGDRPDAGVRLRPPHPAAHGDGALRPHAGGCAPGDPPMVSRGLRRCRRVGRAAQHARHVPVRRRRHHGLQALCRHGQVHRPDERLLQTMPIRPRTDGRRVGLPLLRPLLGFSPPKPGPPRPHSPHGSSAPQLRPSCAG